MYHLEGACYYPGNFNPPTKYHFENALNLQAKRDIGNVIVIIGDGAPEDLSKDDRALIWDIYNKSYFTGRISVVKSKTGTAMEHLLVILDKNPSTKCYVALDEKTARSKETNKIFAKYPNVIYEIIPSSYDGASQKMIEFADNDEMKKFRSLLPQDLSQEAINRILDIVKTKEEPVEDNSEDIKEKVMQMFNDGFWRSVISPVVKNLQEVGDLTNSFNWTHKGEDAEGSHFYKFNTPKNEYTVGISDLGDNTYDASFNTISDSSLDTNEGSAMKVISTFISIVIDFIKNNKPDQVIIHPIETKENDDRRFKIYKLYMTKNTPEGYKVLQLGTSLRYIKTN